MKDYYKKENSKLMSEIIEHLLDDGYSHDEIMKLIYMPKEIINEYHNTYPDQD